MSQTSSKQDTEKVITCSDALGHALGGSNTGRSETPRRHTAIKDDIVAGARLMGISTLTEAASAQQAPHACVANNVAGYKRRADAPAGTFRGDMVLTIAGTAVLCDVAIVHCREGSVASLELTTPVLNSRGLMQKKTRSFPNPELGKTAGASADAYAQFKYAHYEQRYTFKKELLAPLVFETNGAMARCTEDVIDAMFAHAKARNAQLDIKEAKLDLLAACSASIARHVASAVGRYRLTCEKSGLEVMARRESEGRAQQAATQPAKKKDKATYAAKVAAKATKPQAAAGASSKRARGPAAKRRRSFTAVA